jgi:hypothetical protein
MTAAARTRLNRVAVWRPTQKTVTGCALHVFRHWDASYTEWTQLEYIICLCKVWFKHYTRRAYIKAKALCYKPEGLGFETRRGEWLLQFALGFTPPIAKWVPEAEKYCFSGAECGRSVGLTTLPPSVSRLSRQCAILNIPQPYRSSWPVTGISLVLPF